MPPDIFSLDSRDLSNETKLSPSKEPGLCCMPTTTLVHCLSGTPGKTGCRPCQQPAEQQHRTAHRGAHKHSLLSDGRAIPLTCARGSKYTWANKATVPTAGRHHHPFRKPIFPDGAGCRPSWGCPEWQTAHTCASLHVSLCPSYKNRQETSAHSRLLHLSLI